MTKKYKFLIVASTFYPKITEGLLNGAVTELKRLKYNYDIFRVNGSLEIPVQIAILLKRKRYDAVIAVGCIIKGKTDHYEFLSSSIANQLLNLTTHKNVYISNCVLNVLNIEQASERAGSENNKGSESAQALNNLFIT